MTRGDDPLTIAGQDGGSTPRDLKGHAMDVPIVSLVAYGSIVVAALAALPVWPWSRDWGNGNAGALAYILLVVSINAGLGQVL
jgi:Protein of unknown function (DUF3309)